MANTENSEHCDFDSSWSKYQLMVLQQLGDHTEVLQTLNKNVADHKQSAAVHLAEFAMWKAQINQSIENVQDSIDSMLYDEKGVSRRVSTIEQQLNTETQIDNKAKDDWRSRNTIIITTSVIVNLLIQLFVNFIKK
jgi:membrane-bound ClpP family serine protease